MSAVKTTYRRNQGVGKTASFLVRIVSSTAYFFLSRKKLAVIMAVLLLGTFFLINRITKKPTDAGEVKEEIVVEKNFTFTALNGQGQETKDTISLNISTAQKTNQVLVQDKVYTARNNKMFMIIDLKLRNDQAIPLNLYPGNLFRLTYSDDQESKFAPDLHNNLVAISPLSTKLDRIGFVAPEEIDVFNLYVGELEKEKEVVNLVFDSK